MTLAPNDNMDNLLNRAINVMEFLRPVPLSELKVVRLGSQNDGGYLMAQDFSKDDHLISFGIGDNIDYEFDLAELISGMHLYDNSISSLPRSIANAIFFQERIGSEPSTSLKIAVSRVANAKDMLLKMDIEGSEWTVLLESSEMLSTFRQIVVEFHWLENIMDDDFYDKCITVLRSLSETHLVLNSHPNNHGDLLLMDLVLVPQVIEVTYLRKSNYSQFITKDKSSSLDLSLFNMSCNPVLPDFPNINNCLNSSTSFAFRASSLLRTSDNNALISERDALISERDALISERDALKNSTIWKSTHFYRKLVDFIKLKLYS